MACLSYSLTGIPADCTPNMGGIKNAWLAYGDEFTVTPTEATHTAAVAKATGITDAYFYKYHFAKNTSSITSTLTRDDANGIRYYTNEIVLQFNKMSAEKHLEAEAMAAENLIVVVEDNNDICWVVGGINDSYVTASSENVQSGTNFDEMNGYTLTLSNTSGHLPYKVTKADIEAFEPTGE